MSNLITIKTATIPVQLAVAKTYLEDNGIFCFLKDEIISQVYTYAIDGVKLQVREEDVEDAIKLLVEGGFAKYEDFR